MLKPSAPMPGMTDTLDFVKNLWGSMQIPGTGLPGMPGIATPPMSTDDLVRKFRDNAAPLLDEARIDACVQRILTLEDQSDLSAVIDQAAPAVSTPAAAVPAGSR